MPKKPTEGTVSHATMRPEDLLPAFAASLRELSDAPADTAVADEAEAMAARLVQRAADDNAVDGLLEDLFLRLDAIAGEASGGTLYFGAHEGDGSDYGFWTIPKDDSEDEDHD